MKNKNTFIATILFLAGILSRLPFIAKFCTGPDAAQWALTLKDPSQSLLVGLPGHPLYVIMARLINYIIGDAHYSFVALSVLFSGLLAAGIFYVGNQIFSRKIGIIASLILLSAPSFWYYGVSTFYFLPCGFFGLLTALFCYRVIVKGAEKHILGASIFYALMIGVRPQEFIVLFPLWFWALWRCRIKESLKGIIVFGVVCLTWFIPLIIQSGGLLEYLKIINVASKQNLRALFLYYYPIDIIKKNFTIKVKMLLLTYGIGIIPLVYYLYPFFNLKSIFNSIKTRFFIVWITPALILWTFIFFSAHDTGYLIAPFLALMLYLVVAIEATSLEIAEVFNSVSSKLKISARNLSLSFVAVLIVINCFVFLYDFDPQGKAKDDFRYQSYSNIKKKDKMLKAKFDYIRTNTEPENTIVLTRFWYFLPVMYHLPEYRVYGFDSIDGTHGGKLVRFGYQHKKVYYPKEDHTLIIPKGITKIVLFEDDFLEWNKNPELTQIVSLANLYNIQIVKVKEGQTIKCSFKNFSVF